MQFITDVDTFQIETALTMMTQLLRFGLRDWKLLKLTGTDWAAV